MHAQGQSLKRFRWIGLAVASCLTARAGASIFYVSTLGNDANPGTLAAPFRTLTGASWVAYAGDTVYARQGVYRETLTGFRSGNPGAPITFSPYPGETAVLAGSDLVSGAWTPYQGHIWTMAGVSPTTDLFLDGQELPLARWPNVAPGAPMTAGWASAGAGTNASTLVDPTLPSLTPAQAAQGVGVLIISGWNWVSYSCSATGYGAGQFSFPAGTFPASATYQPQPSNAYYLYGNLGLLDAPGEWFQDPASGQLYLWAPGGDDPSAHVVEVAQRKEVAAFNGQSYITLQGLSSFCGGISINGCTGCVVSGVNQVYVQHFTAVNGYTTEPSANFLAGNGCIWTNGSIAYCSGDGLALGGAGNTVSAMLIHDVDQICTAKSALHVWGTGNIISGCSFHDSGRYLLYTQGASGGQVVHNDLYNAGLMTQDLERPAGALHGHGNGGIPDELGRNRAVSLLDAVKLMERVGQLQELP